MPKGDQLVFFRVPKGPLMGNSSPDLASRKSCLIFTERSFGGPHFGGNSSGHNLVMGALLNLPAGLGLGAWKWTKKGGDSCLQLEFGGPNSEDSAREWDVLFSTSTIWL